MSWGVIHQTTFFSCQTHSNCWCYRLKMYVSTSCTYIVNIDVQAWHWVSYFLEKVDRKFSCISKPCVSLERCFSKSPQFSSWKLSVLFHFCVRVFAEGAVTLLVYSSAVRVCTCPSYSCYVRNKDQRYKWNIKTVWCNVKVRRIPLRNKCKRKLNKLHLCLLKDSK